MAQANPETEAAPASAPTSGDESRERILGGAIRSIARHGLERSSIASIAREAGVSRQTVYTYYANREEVIRDAVTRSAIELTESAMAKARQATTANEFMVELTLNVVYGVRENPAISAMLYSLDAPEGREMTMSAPIIDIVVGSLSPLLDYDPSLEPHLDVIAETSMRLTVSLLTFPSERTESREALRAYLSTIAGLILT